MRPLAIAAILAASATAAHAQQTWVAVATGSGSNLGYAVGMATREAAGITSLGECGSGCAIRLTALARCVAYAHTAVGEASGFGAGATIRAAQCFE